MATGGLRVVTLRRRHNPLMAAPRDGRTRLSHASVSTKSCTPHMDPLRRRLLGHHCGHPPGPSSRKTYKSPFYRRWVRLCDTDHLRYQGAKVHITVTLSRGTSKSVQLSKDESLNGESEGYFTDHREKAENWKPVTRT